MSKVYVRERKRLHKVDPRCYWCGRVTIQADAGECRHGPDTATLDHLSRGVDGKHVLACGECNHLRGLRERGDHAGAPIGVLPEKQAEWLSAVSKVEEP